MTVRPAVRVSSQIRSPQDSKIKMGTAFDRGSGNWVRLEPSGAGGYKTSLGQTFQVRTAQESQDGTPPSQGEPQTGPSGSQGLEIGRDRIQELVSVLANDLPVVERARLEGKMGVCLESPSATQIVLTTRLRSRLEAFLADPNAPSGLFLSTEEVMAAQEVGLCAERLEKQDSFKGLGKAAPVIIALAGAGVIGYLIFYS